MHEIFIAAPVPQLMADQLAKLPVHVTIHQSADPITLAELKDGVNNAEILVVPLSTPVTTDVLAAAPHLRLIANYGAGVDNIALDDAHARNIQVVNTPGVSANAVAELTIALILAWSRRLPEGDSLMRHEGFKAWEPLFFLGHEIQGKSLGIVGLGAIGRSVAAKATALGMSVQYWQRHALTSDEEKTLGVHYATLDQLLATSQFVSLHVPLVAGTHHLIDAAKLAKMRHDAVLINVARGPVIDEAALLKALQAGEIAGAALDVYEHEPQVSAGLKKMENVILTPHIGNATVEAREAMAALITANITAYLQGEPLKFTV
ncbi:MAG: NAD(P)-dependent oxidoreductase [Schleiferilactobacillus perolens]|uniref:NAD(P)-dependent oxidoreductase n=1 Tax=Schleiferilactobacillus perolens TaxID=100468 RepID=UPI0039EA597B